MYELPKEHVQQFKELAKDRMLELELTTAELAERTGYSRQSVYNFFSGDNWNRFLAAAIMEELEMEEER